MPKLNKADKQTLQEVLPILRAELPEWSAGMKKINATIKEHAPQHAPFLLDAILNVLGVPIPRTYFARMECCMAAVIVSGMELEDIMNEANSAIHEDHKEHIPEEFNALVKEMLEKAIIMRPIFQLDDGNEDDEEEEDDEEGDSEKSAGNPLMHAFQLSSKHQKPANPKPHGAPSTPDPFCGDCGAKAKLGKAFCSNVVQQLHTPRRPTGRRCGWKSPSPTWLTTPPMSRASMHSWLPRQRHCRCSSRNKKTMTTKKTMTWHKRNP